MTEEHTTADGSAVHSEDDTLLARLREIADEADPMPEIVAEGAFAAFALRDLDSELAELIMDSEADEPALAMRGAGDDVRLLTFESEAVTVEIQVTPEGSERSVLGVVTGATGPVEVETLHHRETETLDELGRFWVTGLASGLVRFRVTPEPDHTVTTRWTTI
jgi:hypothetical protein